MQFVFPVYNYMGTNIDHHNYTLRTLSGDIACICFLHGGITVMMSTENMSSGRSIAKLFAE